MHLHTDSHRCTWAHIQPRTHSESQCSRTVSLSGLLYSCWMVLGLPVFGWGAGEVGQRLLNYWAFPIKHNVWFSSQITSRWHEGVGAHWHALIVIHKASVKCPILNRTDITAAQTMITCWFCAWFWVNAKPVCKDALSLPLSHTRTDTLKRTWLHTIPESRLHVNNAFSM